MNKLTAFVILLVACGFHETAKADAAAANAWYEKSFVEESETTVDAAMSAEWDQLVKEVCNISASKKKWTKAQDKECLPKIDKIYNARLREQYPYADPTLVNNYCDGHPIECKTGLPYEKIIREFNNREVNRRFEEHKGQLDAHHSYQRQLQNQRMGAAFQGMGRALRDMSNPPDAVIEVRER